MTIEQIRKDSDALHAQYQWNFSGFPRGTRDPNELDELAQAASRLISRAEAAGVTPLIETLRERRRLYQQEKREVEAVRNIGPHAIAVSFVFLDVRARHHMYLRNFAGEERVSRDVFALDEAYEELGLMHGEIATLIGDSSSEALEFYLNETEKIRTLFETETAEIRDARRKLTMPEAVSGSARAANTLFARYRSNFAGMPRVSRRPALLARLIEALEDVQRWMGDVEVQGADASTLAKNREIVATQLETWRSEQEAIREARQSCQFGELVRALQVEYDDVAALYSEEFAGKQRASRDLTALDGICSRLDELERMCRRQLGMRDVAELATLLHQVRESRFRFCREFDAIREAKKNPGSLDDSLN